MRRINAEILAFIDVPGHDMHIFEKALIFGGRPANVCEREELRTLIERLQLVGGKAVGIIDAAQYLHLVADPGTSRDAPARVGLVDLSRR